jgi:hypothetical protein
MTQRAVMTPGNPKLSYRSATARTASPVGIASGVSDDSPDSAASHAPEQWPSEQNRDHFPGWLRLAIIGGGALLSWGAIAVAAGLMR